MKLYRRLFSAIKESHSTKYCIGIMATDAVNAYLNAMLLVWLANITKGGPDQLRWVLQSAIACVTITVLDSLVGVLNYGRHTVFSELSIRLVDKILDADTAIYAELSPGVVQHTTGQVWQITTAFHIVTRTVRNVFNLVAVLIAIALVSGAIVIPIAVLTILSSIILYRVNRKWNELDTKMDTTRRERNREVDEIVNGYLEVRSFSGAIRKHRKSIKGKNDAVMGMIWARQMYTALINAVISGSSQITMFIALFWAIGTVAGVPRVPAAETMVLVAYTLRLCEPMMAIVFDISELSPAKVAMENYNKVLDHQDTMADGDVELESFDSELTVEDIKFSYDKSSTILDGVSMRIPKGAHVGICGPSAAGKSSLMNLLGRFYDVDEGAIRIDGVDIRKFTRDSFLKHVGFVHQDVHIFDGTIRDNITYAVQDREVMESELIDACKKAAIYDDIMKMPNGFATKVGPRGIKLSGGQKQRVSLARLFLANPDIIILDEATSALDNETEAVVQNALNELRDKTQIVVAHRLSTIRNCDKIYVIENHKVAECGTHEELMRLGGTYAKLQKR